MRASHYITCCTDGEICADYFTSQQMLFPLTLATSPCYKARHK